MDRNRIILYFNTIKYLKLKQIYFRIFYFLKNQFFKFPIQNKLKIKISNLKWDDTVYNNKTFEKDNKFTFLNITKKFNDRIDWNFKKNGRLWCYNLNYFEYLNQKNFSVNEGLKLINDYVKNDSTINVGKESYPISLRGLNWIKFLLNYNINDKKINHTLFNHYQILLKNIEYHLLGNHILENGFSLFFAGYFFNNKIFLNKSKKILEKELEEQILNDGSHFELSTMYHQMILFRILDCLSFLKINKIDDNFFSVLFKNKAEKMLSFLQTISYKNNVVPLLNDSCNGIVPSSNEFFKYGKSLGLNWSSIHLDQSGYRKWEFDNFEIIMDVGKIGPDYIPGHAHADTFSFELYYNTHPIIIDLGISTYENNTFRIDERSTKSHNTISVNHKNSSEVWSSFRVGKRANVKAILETNDLIKYVHNGYKKLGCYHTRIFLKTKNTFKINDQIESNKRNHLYSNLHFHPESKPEIHDDYITSKGLKMKMIGYIKPKLVEYNYPLGFNKYIKAIKLTSSVKNSSSLEFFK